MLESLPASPDTERCVLGALYKYADMMDAARTTLEDGDFSLDKHQRIWAAMCRAYDSGAKLDPYVVVAALQERNELEAVGGIGYLTDMSEGIPAGNLDYNISRLKEKAALRRAAIAANQVLKGCLSGTMSADEAREALSSAAIGTGTTAGNRPISTTELIDTVGITELLKPRRSEGIRLPWGELQGLLCGLHKGQMIVLAARTGGGKTSMALQIAAHAARQKKAVIVWTLEMSPKQMFQRLINQLARINGDMRRHASMTAEDKARECDAVAFVHSHPIYFDNHSRTIPAFCASVRQIQAKGPVGLVVVDYLQLIRSTGRSENRTREVGENSRSLKLAAMEMDLPFLVLSQFRRPNGDNEQVGIHALKESGDIENDADVILLVSTSPLAGDTMTQAAVTIGKQREGPAGNNVQMLFDPRFQVFHEATERQ